MLETPQKSQSSAANLAVGELLSFKPHGEAEEAEVGDQGRMAAALTGVPTRADRWSRMFLWTINGHFSNCCGKYLLRAT